MFANRSINHQNKRLLGAFAVLHVLISWLSLSSCLPQGAPETVCDTMLPFHGGGIQPSLALSPFRIETSSAIIGQGQTLRVDIVGVPVGLNFGGFMIQARNRSPPHQIIGQFNPPRDGRAKLLNCQDSVNNTATHTNAGPKPEVSLEWQSPVDFEGEIVFNSTVAQNYTDFWVGLQSEPVRVLRQDGSTPPISNNQPTTRTFGTTRRPYVPVPVQPAPAAAVADPLYDNCGVSKTCFGFPNGCIATRSCTSFTVVTVRGDTYEFELKSGAGTNAAYVAVGLSDDDRMGDDLVIECLPENGRVSMYSSITWRSPFSATRANVPQNTARLIDAAYVDGVIYCKVQRDPITVVQGRTFDLANNRYHLLVASGTSVNDNGAGYHDIGRLPSSSPINLAEVQNISGSGYLLVRLHGAFMIAAWIGTTSLGIILARYFKQTWVGSQTCGKDQWFAWHRFCMVITWSLTMVAFVLIFVELGAWSAERNPHAILGLVTTVLCFIQPIGALFRPAPNAKHRPLFNWAHWLGGNVAHILAIVTIFFSVKLTKAELPEWMDWILVGFVVFHIFVHLVFSVAGWASDRQQTQRVNTFQMGDMSPHHHHHHGMRNGMSMERKLDAPYSRFRKILLGVYTIVNLLFVVALILIIALAPIEQTFRNVQSKLN